MKVKVEFSLITTNENGLSFETNGLVKIENAIKTVYFVEQTDMQLPTTILINETENVVILKRSGQIESTMEFNTTKSTLAYFKIDNQYEISMYNYTNYLYISDNFIEIIYQTEMDKEQNITHQLKVKWEKE